MNLTKGKKFKIIILIAVLFICSYPLAYIFAISSQPYKITSKFIHENQEIKNKVGRVFNTRLGFWGTSVNYIGLSQGNAKFTLDIEGEKSQAKVFVSLEKQDGNWMIKSVNLKLTGGKIINIDLVKIQR